MRIISPPRALILEAFNDKPATWDQKVESELIHPFETNKYRIIDSASMIEASIERIIAHYFYDINNKESIEISKKFQSLILSSVFGITSVPRSTLTLFSTNDDVPSVVLEVNEICTSFPEADELRRGNKMARERMSILYDLSAAYKALVIGTSNKTELLLGYGTIYGDIACAINPIGDLYKTQVRQLAKHLGVPDCIIKKPPTADLWVGQEDEKELGFTYEEADKLLYLMIDKRLTNQELIDLGLVKNFITNVQNRIQQAQYKRKLPLIAKISQRTIEQDFRYPRDWNK